MNPSVPENVRAELAPGGVLRAGVNLGNAVIAQADPAGGPPRGVGPSLARELARRLGARIEYVTYDAAGKMADALRRGEWDVAFLAAEPQRANEIAFSAPYVRIESGFMVRADSPLTRLDEFDRKGLRIASGNNAAYDLWLQRNFKNAERVLSPTTPGAIEMFLSRTDLDAVANVRPALVAAAAKNPGMRVIEGSFMSINQAAGVPREREAAARYVREFIEEMKSSGFVAKALEDSGVTEATVAPAER
jgi:polar amino acid transport system substrate-binding protein